MVDRISKNTFNLYGDPYEPKSEIKRLKEEIITLKEGSRLLEKKVEELEKKLIETKLVSDTNSDAISRRLDTIQKLIKDNMINISSLQETAIQNLSAKNNSQSKNNESHGFFDTIVEMM